MIAVFLLTSFFLCSSPMKPPVKFQTSVIVTEKEKSVIYQIKTNDDFCNYSLSYIEFSDVVYETKKINDLNILVFEKNGMFCFELSKDNLPKKSFRDPWIYLYNKATKRYECYQV